MTTDKVNGEKEEGGMKGGGQKKGSVRPGYHLVTLASCTTTPLPHKLLLGEMLVVVEESGFLKCRRRKMKVDLSE